MNKIHEVPSLDHPMRLQEYGVGIFLETQTKSALKKIVKKERIRVNNKVATTATFIYGGEQIELLQEQSEPTAKPLKLHLELYYEDDYLACIYKPSGILVSGNKHRTIANALSENLRRSSLSDACSPKPVHRLDFATSGLLLVGKTHAAIRQLNKDFENKAVAKQYIAIVHGEIAMEGRIDLAVDEKTSRTEFKRLASLKRNQTELFSLVQLSPKTGRRHQLRKHLASIGNPILGDAVYGGSTNSIRKGLFLHASSLTFEHPYSKESIVLSAPIATKFISLFPSIKHLAYVQ